MSDAKPRTRGTKMRRRLTGVLALGVALLLPFRLFIGARAARGTA